MHSKKKSCFSYSSFFTFSCRFQNNVVSIYKKSCWDFNRNCVKPINLGRADILTMLSAYSFVYIYIYALIYCIMYITYVCCVRVFIQIYMQVYLCLHQYDNGIFNNRKSPLWISLHQRKQVLMQVFREVKCNVNFRKAGGIVHFTPLQLRRRFTGALHFPQQGL